MRSQADQPCAPARDEGISRNLRVLGAVSLAQDVGSEVVYPLLPSFVTGVLGAPVAALGVAEGLADAVAALMKLVAGRLATTGRRKPWIAFGYGLATVGKLVVASAVVWPLVLVGRVVDRIGKGIRGVPRDALIAEESSTEHRGRSFGFHRAMDTLGAVIGPLLALGLLQVFNGKIRPALLIAVLPATISVLLVRLVHEQPEITPSATKADDWSRQRAALPRAFWSTLAPLVVFALANSSNALLLQRAHDLGLSTSSVVMVYVLYNVVAAALSYPAGLISDRFSPRLAMIAGLLVFSSVYLGLGRVTHATLVWVLLPAYGTFTACTDGVSRTWIANLVNDRSRTWALGVHGGLTSAATLLAGLWSGLAWRGNGRLPLTVSGLVALSVALWLIATRGTEDASEPGSQTLLPV
jgi:MFS family permease